MRLRIVGSKSTGWELVLDGEMEPVGVVENATFEQALDALAANWPEYAEELDELRCDDDFLGVQVVERRSSRRNGGGERKRGSGARFRELMIQGKTNAECLEIIRAEFPESKATLSDAAFNRAMLRKNPSGFRPDGTKV